MVQIPRSVQFSVMTLFLVPPFLSAQEPKEPKPPPELKKVAVADGVELHYVEKGKGVPVVFIAGDYAEWDHHLGAFAEHYRAIASTGRYNYPNTNKIQPVYSPAVAADDLAGLIKKLELGKVHIVGHSLGMQTALFLAMRHPELVRTLSLSEGGVRFKGEEIPERVLLGNKKALAAFEKGNTVEALEFVAGRFIKLSEMPEVLRTRMLRNARAVEASMKGDGFPEVDREAVRKISIPTLVMYGADSWIMKLGPKLSNEELRQRLPEKNLKLVIVPGAGHGVHWSHKEQYRKEVLEFLKDK